MSYLIVALILLSWFLIFWNIYIKTRKASLVDLAWSLSFSLVALFFLSTRNEVPDLLFFSSFLSWSLRLGIFLGVTRFVINKKEDQRYEDMKTDNEAADKTKFLYVYLFQALTVLLLTLPWHNYSASTHSNYYMIFIVLANLCIIGEFISDWQLFQFKSLAHNKGKVCKQGLWKYSRHPNYFFELSFWFSMSLAYLSICNSYIHFISFILMTYFILYFSGIKRMEGKTSTTRSKEYQDYVEKTSSLIPWFPKK